MGWIQTRRIPSIPISPRNNLQASVKNTCTARVRSGSSRSAPQPPIPGPFCSCSCSHLGGSCSFWAVLLQLLLPILWKEQLPCPLGHSLTKFSSTASIQGRCQLPSGLCSQAPVSPLHGSSSWASDFFQVFLSTWICQQLGMSLILLRCTTTGIILVIYVLYYNCPSTDESGPSCSKRYIDKLLKNQSLPQRAYVSISL